MPVLIFSAQLDINLAIVEEHPDGIKATAYFEDYLFKLFQDIEAINVAAGTVLTLTLPGTDLILTQSTGISPITVDLSSLDGRVTALTLPAFILNLAQSTGVSPLTVDLTGLDGRVTSLTLPANVLNLAQTTGVSPLTIDLSGLDGRVTALTLPAFIFTLAQSTGTSPLTLDLTGLDGRVLALTLPANILTLTQSTGTSPLTIDLTGLDGTVLTLTFDSATDTITLTQSTGTSPITVDLSTFNIVRNRQEQSADRMYVESDFTAPPGGLQVEGIQSIAASGGFVSTPTGTYDFTNHPGVWGLNTGAASAAGRVFLLSQFPGTMHIGVGGVTRVLGYFQAPATLSVALQRFVLRFGFFSMALPNTINEGCGFEYQDDQNGGRWQAICDDAPGVETSVDTGITVVASTYYKLEFEVNAAGTSVEFFIDDVSVATIATNIPAGTSFSLFFSIHIMKLVGLGNRAPYIDYYSIRQELSR